MSKSGLFLEIDEFERNKCHPTGRPPKLNSAIIEEICDLIIEGQTIAKAANMRGISESTIYRWLKLGKEPNSESIYKELVARVYEATELSEFELLQGFRIAASKKKDPRHYLLMLERRFPERYAKPELRLAQSEPKSSKNRTPTKPLKVVK